MDKNDSLVLKGVAILMMLYLHLFNNIDNASICTPALYVSNTPILFLLTRLTKPVHLFLILGGYGLFRVGGGTLIKIYRLYMLYWIILLFFLFCGMFMFPHKYPGSGSEFILNFLSLKSTYNKECWFLFPYVIISIGSLRLFRIVENIKWFYIIGVTFVLSMMVSVIFVVFGNYVNNNWYFIQPLEILSFLFPFFIGVLLAREKVFERMNGQKNKVYWWGILVLLMIIRICFHGNTIMDIVYCTIFIFSYIMAPHSLYVSAFLHSLGRESTGMWMIHTWICYYLFHDLLYSLHSSVLIYITLVLISYFFSKIFNKTVNLLVRNK